MNIILILLILLISSENISAVPPNDVFAETPGTSGKRVHHLDGTYTPATTRHALRDITDSLSNLSTSTPGKRTASALFDDAQPAPTATPTTPTRPLGAFNRVLKPISPDPKRRIRHSYTSEDRIKAQEYANILDATLTAACSKLPSPLPRPIANEVNEFALLFAYMREHLDLLNIMNRDTMTPINRLTLIRAVRNVLQIGHHYNRIQAVIDPTTNMMRIVIQSDENIDLQLRDERGRSNLTRMKSGLPPIGPDGRPIQVHHLAQDDRYELVELTSAVHDSFHRFLHYKVNASSPQDRYLDYEQENSDRLPTSVDRRTFAKFVRAYWQERARGFETNVQRNLGALFASMPSSVCTNAATPSIAAAAAAASSSASTLADSPAPCASPLFGNGDDSLDSFGNTLYFSALSPELADDDDDDDDSSVVLDDDDA